MAITLGGDGCPRFGGTMLPRTHAKLCALRVRVVRPRLTTPMMASARVCRCRLHRKMHLLRYREPVQCQAGPAVRLVPGPLARWLSAKFRDVPQAAEASRHPL